MQNKDKGDGIEDSPLDMLLVILFDGASKEVVMPSSYFPSMLAGMLSSALVGIFQAVMAKRWENLIVSEIWGDLVSYGA